VEELLHEGYTDVVDADLSKYFDPFRTPNFYSVWLGESSIGTCCI